MRDLESIIKNLPGEGQFRVLSALKILVDTGLFSALARANANHLVVGRMDSDDSNALVNEIREIRQTNRILLGLEESAKQLTKGIDNA